MKVAVSTADLTPLLLESLAQVRLKKLNDRVVAIEQGHKSGRLGQHVVRARLHYIEKEHEQLVVEMGREGFNFA